MSEATDNAEAMKQIQQCLGDEAAEIALEITRVFRVRTIAKQINIIEHIARLAAAGETSTERLVKLRDSLTPTPDQPARSSY